MDEKTKDRIVELFDAGSPLADISVEVGYAESYMTRVLYERGRSAWKRKYPHAEHWDMDAIFADYKSGLRMEELLQKHHISNSAFHRNRRKAGIPTRPRLGYPGKKNYQYKHGNGNQSRKRVPELTKQVAALCLGHIVPRGWQLHHLDGDPSNNHPENIAVFHDKSEHAKYHQQELKLQRANLPVDASQLVSENGGFLLQSPDHPIVLPHEKGRLDPRISRTKPRQDRPASEPAPAVSGPQ